MKYLGPCFSLAALLGSAVACVWSVAASMPILMTIASGSMTLVCSYIVIAVDWFKTWKPLLTGNK